MSLRRRSDASPRRYDNSALSPRRCAKAASATSRGNVRLVPRPIAKARPKSVHRYVRSQLGQYVAHRPLAHRLPSPRSGNKNTPTLRNS